MKTIVKIKRKVLLIISRKLFGQLIYTEFSSNKNGYLLFGFSIYNFKTWLKMQQDYSLLFFRISSSSEALRSIISIAAFESAEEHFAFAKT